MINAVVHQSMSSLITSDKHSCHELLFVSVPLSTSPFSISTLLFFLPSIILFSHVLTSSVLFLSMQADSGPVLCAGYEDGSLVLWDVSHRRPFSCLKAHHEPVMCLDVDVCRQKGISGSSEKILQSWIFDNQQNLQVNLT